MSEWSLSQLPLLADEDYSAEDGDGAEDVNHPVTKVDDSETVWIQLAETYLPKRYQRRRRMLCGFVSATSATDRRGRFDSQSFDLILHI